MDTPPSQDSLPSQVYLLGFDIGGTKTAAVFGSLEGEIIDRSEASTPAAEPFESAFERMIATAEEVLERASRRGYPPPAGVSVAVGGPLDIERGVIYSPPHLPTWDSVRLKSRLEEYFCLPVFVEHDGNAGALAEFYFGAGQGKHNLVYLTMGTGLGAGLILDGRVYRGTTDLAGEVGHMRIAEAGPLEYGKAGSWEGYCSAAGLVKLAVQKNPQAWPKGMTAHEIIQQALGGDEAAVALIQEVGVWLGKGIAVLVDLLNPQMVVIGTLGVVLGDMLLEPARQVVQREALAGAAKACQIVPSGLGGRLGDRAALAAAMAAYRTGKWDGLPTHPKEMVREMDRTNQAQSRERVLASLSAGLEVRKQTIARLTDQITETAMLMVQILQKGGKVLVFGNGGSAAAAQHMTGELTGRYKAERRPLPAIALTADSSLLTCIANDYAFDTVFARQVRALAQPGDLVIGLTTSGRSPNVLEGLLAAQEAGVLTLALTGENGLAKPAADYVLCAPSGSTARIQEEHEAIIHAWCEVIDAAFIE
jgi:glucokinase